MKNFKKCRWEESPGPYPIPDARGRGIIGKVGNGNPFVVSNYNRLEFQLSGRLYLGINDINFGNNIGYCTYFLIKDPLSSVADTPNELNIPEGFHLLGNYPNPFNPQTTIRYNIDEPGEVDLRIINNTGQLVKVLVNSAQAANSYEVQWDGKTQQGQDVASGLYFYCLSVNGKNMTGKALLIR